MSAEVLMRRAAKGGLGRPSSGFWAPAHPGMPSRYSASLTKPAWAAASAAVRVPGQLGPEQ
ncbi:MAG: hypothetical protein QM767_06250 [Anaeromyxobacter sp.]